MEMKLYFVFDENGDFLGIGDKNLLDNNEYNYFDNFHDACKFYVKYHVGKDRQTQINTIFNKIEERIKE